MKYTVVWIQTAQEELAELWNNAGDRNAVTAASNHIDHILKTAPYSNSESREGNLRIIFVPPLAALYDVSDDDRMVTVRAVWRPD
jgi:hypothetical protein